MPSIPLNLEESANKLEPESTTTWLLEIALPGGSEYIRITSNNESLVFDGNTYEPFPFEVPTDEQNADGNAGQIEISIGNVGGVWDEIMKSYNGLTDAVVRMYYGQTAFLATPSDWISQTLTVTSSQESGQRINPSLTPRSIFNVSIPQTTLWRDNCPHTYKDQVTCKYSGNLATCSQKYFGPNGCLAHENTKNFGGNPSIPRPK